MKHFTLAAIIAAALIASPASAADTVKINVAYHPNMHGAAIMAIAEEQGYFEEEGLDVEASRFTSGAPELNAMISGHLDLGYLGPGAMPAVMRGEVQLLTVDHPDANERVLADPSTGVKTPADLAGQTVYFASGTTGEFVVRAALKSAGLTIDDIEAQNATDEVSTTAYISGRAPIIAVGPTFTNQAISTRDSVVVFNSDEDDNFSLPGFWIANKEFVAEHPETVTKFLRAFAKANDYRAGHLNEIVPLVSRYAKTPEPILQEQVDLTVWWDTQEISEHIEDGTVETMLRQLNTLFQETGKMAEIAEIDTYFDPSIAIDAFSSVNQ